MANGSFGYVLWIGSRMIGTGGLFMPRDSKKLAVVEAIRAQAQESCKGKAVKFTVDEFSGIFPLWPSAEPTEPNATAEYVGNGVYCVTPDREAE